MRIQERVRLSFNGKPVVKRCGNITVASVKSYFKADSLSRMFRSEHVPEFVSSLLAKNGYIFDPVLNIYSKKITSTIFLSPNDEDDPAKAANISRTKVKHKAYKDASRTLEEISDVIDEMSVVMAASYKNLRRMESDEFEALERCRETGYCDPNKVEA